MWWCVATLTTVGYGDVFPITSLRKFLSTFISILGICMFALPDGILTSGFSAEFKKLNIKEVVIVPIVVPNWIMNASFGIAIFYF